MLSKQNSFNPAAPLLHLGHARVPYAIEVSAEMMPRLLAAVKNGEARGCEVGGLLIGSFPKAGTLTLRIEDFVLLDRRSDDEKQFELSVDQRARLSTMRHKLLGQQRRALGIFRSHLRTGKESLALSTADRELVAAEFGRAIHVGLLIGADPPHTSAFFLPDANGVLETGPPLPEFQFNAEELARLAPRGAALVSAPPVDTVAAGSARQPKFIWWAAGAWLTAVLFLCLSLTVWAPATMGMLFSPDGLHLDVERRGGMLELRWNRRQPDLARARSAMLSIQDSGTDHRVVLGPAEIRGGQLAYQPAGRNVTFRLNVVLPDSTELVQTATFSGKR